MKRLLKTIFGRLTVVLAAIFLQVWLFVYIIFELGAEYRYVDLGIKLLAVIFVFWILNNWMNPAYKLLWSILILAVPVVGVVLYYIMGQSRVTRQVRRRYESAVELCKPLMQQKEVSGRRTRTRTGRAAISAETAAFRPITTRRRSSFQRVRRCTCG